MEVRPVSGSDMLRTVRLRTSDTQIREVVITATQVRGPVSGVHIGRDAMNHIQPSSFGDLLGPPFFCVSRGGKVSPQGRKFVRDLRITGESSIKPEETE